MEPLELGPNAGNDARGPPLPDMALQQENDDVYEVGDPPRFSAQDVSVGSGRAASHDSTEVKRFECRGTQVRSQVCVAPRQGTLTRNLSALSGNARRSTLHLNEISVATFMVRTSSWGTRVNPGYHILLTSRVPAAGHSPHWTVSCVRDGSDSGGGARTRCSRQDAAV